MNELKNFNNIINGCSSKLVLIGGFILYKEISDLSDCKDLVLML